MQNSKYVSHYINVKGINFTDQFLLFGDNLNVNGIVQIRLSHVLTDDGFYFKHTHIKYGLVYGLDVNASVVTLF